MMFIRSLADFNGTPWAVQVTVGAITVTAQATNSSDRHDKQGNGDFYLAISGDLQLATNGDFHLATDSSNPYDPPRGTLGRPPGFIAKRIESNSVTSFWHITYTRIALKNNSFGG
jgi:hypothetical protein